jgi:hypothetical protein
MNRFASASGLNTTDACCTSAGVIFHSVCRLNVGNGSDNRTGDERAWSHIIMPISLHHWKTRVF